MNARQSAVPLRTEPYAKLRNDQFIDILRRENPDPALIVFLVVAFIVVVLVLFQIYQKQSAKKRLDGTWIDETYGEEYEVVTHGARLTIYAQKVAAPLFDGGYGDGALRDASGFKGHIATDRIVFGDLSLKKLRIMP